MKAKATFFRSDHCEVRAYNDKVRIPMSLTDNSLEIEMISPGAYIETYLEFPTPADALEFAERVRRLAEEWQRNIETET